MAELYQWYNSHNILFDSGYDWNASRFAYFKLCASWEIWHFITNPKYGFEVVFRCCVRTFKQCAEMYCIISTVQTVTMLKEYVISLLFHVIFYFLYIFFEELNHWSLHWTIMPLIRDIKHLKNLLHIYKWHNLRNNCWGICLTGLTFVRLWAAIFIIIVIVMIILILFSKH